MPFTSEQIAAILDTLDAIHQVTAERIARNTAPVPVLVALENAAFAVSQAHGFYTQASAYTSPEATPLPQLQEAI
jgi:hypothetical protein